jgi:hypothetical protein
MSRSFADSSSSSLTTGMPVMTETTAAMSSASTSTSLSRLASIQPRLSSLSRARASFSLSRIFAAFSYSWARIAASFSLTSSSRFCSRSRISAGTVETDRRARAEASSITSIALYGRKRAFI